MMGCAEPAQIAVWEDGEDGFFSCPIRWIGENIFAWWDRYHYMRESNRWPNYDDIGNRQLEAIRFYESERNRFSMQLDKNRRIPKDLKSMRRANA
jgi:hypothetical protein